MGNSSDGGMLALLLILFFAFVAVGPGLMRRALNPVEDAAKNIYHARKNAVTGDTLDYVANHLRGARGLAPELEAAISRVPNRAPRPGDREAYEAGE